MEENWQGNVISPPGSWTADKGGKREDKSKCTTKERAPYKNMELAQCPTPSCSKNLAASPVSNGQSPAEKPFPLEENKLQG